MKKLSASPVVERLGQIKALIHDDDINLANIRIEETIKEITGWDHTCERCGGPLSKEAHQMAGEYCEPCFEVINDD
jgi:rRNA maturation endonuclease Nob1